MKKLKEIYPQSTPLTLKTKEETFKTMSYSWGMIAHEPYYDEAAKVWKYTDTDPKYKEMLDFMKKLYDEKLLDPEFLTMTQAALSLIHILRKFRMSNQALRNLMKPMCRQRKREVLPSAVFHSAPAGQ